MHVPAELAKRPNWIVWKTIARDGKPTKVPFNPMTFRLASTTDPATWATLTQAQTALATLAYSGLGFVFGRDDCVFGVDLDVCKRSLFELEPWASEIIQQFRTYAEVSPSRVGVKLFGIGEHQRKGCVKVMGDASPGGKRPAIEVYGWGRFFAFTGERVADAEKELTDCRAQLAALLATMTPPRDVTPPPPRVATPPNHERSKLERGRLYLRKVPGAQSGSGGHNRTFRAAVVLVREIGLSQADAFKLLEEWNERCQPPWSESELWHKVASAAKAK